MSVGRAAQVNVLLVLGIPAAVEKLVSIRDA